MMNKLNLDFRARNRLLLVGAVIAVGIVYFVHLRLWPFAFDDAYIHFRIVRNLVETGFPYFNLNEAVKVSTSSGWTIFLSPFYWFARQLNREASFPLLVSLINATITIGVIFVYTRIIQRLLQRPLTISEQILFQIPLLSIVLPPSLGLMETPLALLLAGIGIYLILLESRLGYALLALAAYFRLELAILFLVAFIYAVLSKKLKLSQLFFIGLFVTPLLLYDVYFFGTILPQSLEAKSTIYSISKLQSALSILFASFPTVPIRYSQPVGGVILMSVLAVTAMMLVRSWRENQKRWPMVLFVAAMSVIAVYIMGNTLVFDWYRAIYLLPIFIASFVFIDHERGIGVKINHYLLLIFLSVPILTTLLASVNNPGLFNGFEGGSRVKNYLQIGAILQEEFPNATLLSSEIGGLGYAFGGRISDAVGLASPEALDFHPLKIPEQRSYGDVGAIPPDFVKTKMPELVVSYDIFAEALLKDQVLQSYQVIRLPAYLPEDAHYAAIKAIWGSQYLRVFIRNDIKIPDQVLSLDVREGDHNEELNTRSR